MAPKAFFLNEADREALQEFLSDWQQRNAGYSGRPPDMTIDREEILAPEVYVALTPEDGIPALEFDPSAGLEDIPGSADCDVYNLIEDETGTLRIEPIIDVFRLVHNLSTDAIPGDTWILVIRDKYGHWFAYQPFRPVSEGADVCQGCGFLADLPLTTCFRVRMRGGYGRCSCITAEGESAGSIAVYYSPLNGWLTTGMEDTCCGCGAVVIVVNSDTLTATGFVDNVHISCVPGAVTGTGTADNGSLVIVNLKLVCCGRNPITSKPYMAFVGWGAGACDGEQVPCDNVFYLTAECVACPVQICTCCCIFPSPPAYILTGGTIFTPELFENNRLNGSWILTYVPNDPLGHCTWRGLCAPVTGVSVTSTLRFDGTDFRLDHGNSTYTLPLELWSCSGVNVLDWVSGGGDSPPTKITLTPIFPYSAAMTGTGTGMPDTLECSPPDELVVEFTSPTCPLFNFSRTVVRSIGTNDWVWTNPSPSGDYIGTVTFSCLPGIGWQAGVGGVCNGVATPWGITSSGPPVSYSFTPFFLNWIDQTVTGISPSGAPACCNEGAGATITVSE